MSFVAKRTFFFHFGKFEIQLKLLNVYKERKEKMCDTVDYNGDIRQLRDRGALLMFKMDPLRTKRSLSLYKVDGDSALLGLNGTSLKSDLALFWLSTDEL